MHVAYGSLRLNKMAIEPSISVTKAKVHVGDTIINGKLIKRDQAYQFEFENTVELKKGQVLQINLS